MFSILELIKDQPVAHFDPGQVIIEQGARTGKLLVLLLGSVEVLRDDVQVATESEPGAIFGEIAMLLDGDHIASLRALTRCTFRVIENPLDRLKSSPELSLHLAQSLARRLDALNKYLVDVRHRYEGDEHLGMVDEVLEALLRRHPLRD